jgi:hypothetical protein
MSNARLRLGIFLLLGLAAGQCQTNTTPPTSRATATDAAKQAAARKAAAAKAAAEKAAAEKTADKKAAQAPAGAASTAPTTEAATTPKPVHVVVLAVANDQLSLDVTTLASAICNPDSACNIHLTVADNMVKDQLKQLNKGDHIQIVYSADAKSQNILKAWCVDSVSPPPWSRMWVLLASAGACFLLTLLFSQGRPTQLIISEDNRYSNSRFQMAVWFFVLTTTYVAALGLRVLWAGWDFTGGVNIPKNLLLLSGLSAITYAGAKGITSTKLAAPPTPGQPAPASMKRTAPDGPNFFRDLTHNDGIPAQPAQAEVLGPPPAAGLAPAIIRPPVPAKDAVPPQFDFGDFQMVIVTLVAVATYIVLIFNFFGHVEYSKIVSLPDVDTTLLATFGLGQGAYLTKKAVGNVGTS